MVFNTRLNGVDNLMSRSSIVLFGDSILKGVLYRNGKYEVNHHWEALFSESFPVTLINRSRFGNTIQKALPGLKRHCSSAAVAPEYALLELGGNDCDYEWASVAAAPDGKHLCKTPAEVFIASYREAVTLLRESGRIPVAVTLPPILPERYLQFICSKGLSRSAIMEWLGSENEIARWQHTYSSLVKQIAREEQIPLLDLRHSFPQDPDKLKTLIGSDGIHPSLSGQELIYEFFRRTAETVLS